MIFNCFNICWLRIVIYPCNKNQQDAEFTFNYVSIINLCMFRAGLLLIIRRYYSVYAAIVVCHGFMLTGLAVSNISSWFYCKNINDLFVCRKSFPSQSHIRLCLSYIEHPVPLPTNFLDKPMWNETTAGWQVN
jgi:hypothetical protein